MQAYILCLITIIQVRHFAFKLSASLSVLQRSDWITVSRIMPGFGGFILFWVCFVRLHISPIFYWRQEDQAVDHIQNSLSTKSSPRWEKPDRI